MPKSVTLTPPSWSSEHVRRLGRGEPRPCVSKVHAFRDLPHYGGRLAIVQQPTPEPGVQPFAIDECHGENSRPFVVPRVVHRNDALGWSIRPPPPSPCGTAASQSVAVAASRMVLRATIVPRLLCFAR